MIIKISNLILIILIYSKLTAKCETIHFTNSPQHLLNSNNFTTYKIEVPGSKPITIIEANKESDYENREQTLVKKNYLKDNYNLNAENLNLQATLGVVVSDRDKHPLLPTAADKASSNTGNPMDSRNSAAVHSHMRKTVYSPVLLNKFLKEYAEKLSNLDPVTKEKLNEIVQINHSANNNDKEHEDNERDVTKEIVSAVASASASAAAGNAESADSTSAALKNFQRKSYHPYNIKDGWVTLEAVPWSSSKISKWQSHSGNKHGGPYSSSGVNSWQEEDSGEIPHPGGQHGYGGSVYAGAHSSAPGSSSSSVLNSYNNNNHNDNHHNNNNNHHNNNNYNKPSYNFHSSATNYQKPFNGNYDNNGDDNRRPLKPDYYLTGTVEQQDTWYDHGYKPNNAKPWSSDPDIITDNRPTNFPKYPVSRPHFNEYPNDRVHQPQSYPSAGSDGEWVLISTTKGYQYPRRHGQRAISFTPAPNVSVHKGVKLTVLPYNGPDAVKGTITTSHNGLLEVAPNSKPIESYVNVFSNDNSNSNSNNSHKKITKLKKKPLRKVPLSSKDSASDSSAVLAAAAAGMVPATMAILAPLVLGRRRRRRDTYSPLVSYHLQRLPGPAQYFH